MGVIIPNPTVETEDGATSVTNVKKIEVTDGTLTDDGSRIVSIDTSGGGGSTAGPFAWTINTVDGMSAWAGTNQWIYPSLIEPGRLGGGGTSSSTAVTTKAYFSRFQVPKVIADLRAIDWAIGVTAVAGVVIADKMWFGVYSTDSYGVPDTLLAQSYFDDYSGAGSFTSVKTGGSTWYDSSQVALTGVVALSADTSYYMAWCVDDVTLGVRHWSSDAHAGGWSNGGTMGVTNGASFQMFYTGGNMTATITAGTLPATPDSRVEWSGAHDEWIWGIKVVGS